MNINIYKVTFLLYQLLIFLNCFVIYLFFDKEIAKKKFLPAGGSWLFFISPGQWIGNEQLFKVGLGEFNQFLQEGKAYLNLFPGAKAKQLNHHATEFLAGHYYDSAIIHVGINDLLNGSSTGQISMLLKLHNDVEIEVLVKFLFLVLFIALKWDVKQSKV